MSFLEAFYPTRKGTYRLRLACKCRKSLLPTGTVSVSARSRSPHLALLVDTTPFGPTSDTLLSACIYSLVCILHSGSTFSMRKIMCHAFGDLTPSVGVCPAVSVSLSLRRHCLMLLSCQCSNSVASCSSPAWSALLRAINAVATGDLAAIAALVGKQPDALLRFDSDDAHCACALSIGDSPPCTIGRISPHEAIFTAVLPKAGGAAFDDDYWRLDFSIEHIEESLLKLITLHVGVPAHQRMHALLILFGTPRHLNLSQLPKPLLSVQTSTYTASPPYFASRQQLRPYQPLPFSVMLAPSR